MFNRCTEGLRVKGAEWLELSRGLERERIEADGVIVGHMTESSAARVLSQVEGDDVRRRRCRTRHTAARRKDLVSGHVVAIMARLSRSDAEDILYNEARMLDERRYRDWLATLTADAIYWVPAGGDGVRSEARGRDYL